MAADGSRTVKAKDRLEARLSKYLRVGDYTYVEVTTGGRRFISVLGLVTRRYEGSSRVDMLLRDLGPRQLKLPGGYVAVPTAAAPPFCARCYRDEREHVGGWCLYSSSKYLSVKDAY